MSVDERGCSRISGRNSARKWALKARASTVIHLFAPNLRSSPARLDRRLARKWAHMLGALLSHPSGNPRGICSMRGGGGSSRRLGRKRVWTKNKKHKYSGGARPRTPSSMLQRPTPRRGPNPTSRRASPRASRPTRSSARALSSASTRRPRGSAAAAAAASQSPPPPSSAAASGAGAPSPPRRSRGPWAAAPLATRLRGLSASGAWRRAAPPRRRSARWPQRGPHQRQQ